MLQAAAVTIKHVTKQHKKHKLKNPLPCLTQNEVLYYNDQSIVPFRETVAVYSEYHTKRLSTYCGQNVQFLYIAAGSSCSNHCALKGWPHGLFPGDVTY
jgi:hypothetical protein